MGLDYPGDLPGAAGDLQCDAIIGAEALGEEL